MTKPRRRARRNEAPGAEERKSASPLDRPLQTEELPASLECPFCGRRESEQFSTFGSSLSVSQYYCHACRTVFEAFKWRDRADRELPEEEGEEESLPEETPPTD